MKQLADWPNIGSLYALLMSDVFLRFKKNMSNFEIMRASGAQANGGKDMTNNRDKIDSCSL